MSIHWFGYIGTALVIVAYLPQITHLCWVMRGGRRSSDVVSQPVEAGRRRTMRFPTETCTGSSF
jgi:hypothetical protein